MTKGKKIIRFYNNTGKLENIVKFLESIQKKIDYLDINCTVEGKVIKIKLSGPRDLQHLAIGRIKDLAEQLLE